VADTCQATQRAAVTRAAQAIDARLDLIRCQGPRLVLRIFPHHTAPLDIELRRPAGESFRRAGILGISPIVEVADYNELPAGQRAAFERLVDYLGRRTTSATALMGDRPAPAPEGDPAGDVPYYLLIGLLALWLAGTGRRIGPRPSRRIALSVFALGLALRLVFGLWGPLHVNGQGALWVSGTLRSALLSLYGPGYHELFAWVGLFARPDHALFVANAILGALVPVLVYRLAETLDMRRAGALFAALVLCFDPVSVRIAASESYLPGSSCLVLLAGLGVALAVRNEAHGARSRAFWALLAAGLFAAQATRTHPVSWLPLALTPLIAFGSSHALRKRLKMVLAATLSVGGASLLLSGDVLMAGLAVARQHGGHAEPMGIGVGSWPLLVLAATALLLRRRAKPAALVLLAFASVVADLATRRVYGQSAVWMASFDRLYLPGIALGVSAYWPRPWRRLPIVAVAAAGAALWLGRDVPRLFEPTTEQLEYDFLATEFAHSPPGCWVAGVRRAGQRVLSLPAYAVPRPATGERGRDLPAEGAGQLDSLVVRTPCLLYVHDSLCQSAEGGALCREVEAGARLERIGGVDLPARPSYDLLPYDAERVRVEVYRVLRRD